MPKLHKLTKSDEIELGRMFTETTEDISETMRDMTHQIIHLFNENKGIFSKAKENQLNRLREFLDDRPDLKIDAKTIRKIIKIFRNDLKRELHHIEHDYLSDGDNLSLGEDKLEEYSVKIFSTYFRDDLIRVMIDRFLSRYPLETKEKVKVPLNTQKIIYDILKDSPLTMLLVGLMERGLAQKTDNPKNDYEFEEEVKLLHVDKKSIINQIKDRGGKILFKGLITDTYFDYPEDERTLQKSGGVKSTFRTRKKESDDDGGVQDLFTLKRKLSPDEEAALIERGKLEPQVIETRRCHEFEEELTDLVILNISLFQKIIKDYGLVVDRGGPIPKYRESYQIPGLSGIKFDFDSYKGYCDILELEAERNKTIEDVLRDKKLDLAKYKRLVSGKTKFFAHPGTKIN